MTTVSAGNSCPSRVVGQSQNRATRPLWMVTEVTRLTVCINTQPLHRCRYTRLPSSLDNGNWEVLGRRIVSKYKTHNHGLSPLLQLNFSVFGWLLKLHPLLRSKIPRITGDILQLPFVKRKIFHTRFRTWVSPY